MHQRPGPQVPPQALAPWPRRPFLLSPPLSPLPALLRARASVGRPSRNAFPEGASPLAARSPPAPASAVPNDAGLGALRPEAAALLPGRGPARRPNRTALHWRSCVVPLRLGFCDSVKLGTSAKRTHLFFSFQNGSLQPSTSVRPVPSDAEREQAI